jgi:hypothetical protein
VRLIMNGEPLLIGSILETCEVGRARASTTEHRSIQEALRASSIS